VAAYTTLKNTVPTADTIPSRRALAVKGVSPTPTTF
jgi:hypothetical protein